MCDNERKSRVTSILCILGTDHACIDCKRRNHIMHCSHVYRSMLCFFFALLANFQLGGTNYFAFRHEATKSFA
jgi:hypothetical protein